MVANQTYRIRGGKMTKALIVVDQQVDFCEGGSLAVEGGLTVGERIANLLANHRGDYGIVVATKDWHDAPPSNNGGHFALDPEQPDYVNTWPVHCVSGTPGAEFSPALAEYVADHPLPTVHKGMGIAAYSGFEGIFPVTQRQREENLLAAIFGDADLDFVPPHKAVRLADYLNAVLVDEVDVVGLAADYCVAATARDAIKAGFKAHVLPDFTAGIAHSPEEVAEEIEALNV